jgi:hypothetical protein
LISSFNTIIDKYKAERHKLLCREDCLKGFYREMSKVFDDPQRFPTECREDLKTTINHELCAIEKAKCCQKSLEWKLEKTTRLISKQKEAESAWKKAEDAFAQIKDLPKWIGDQFAEMEKLKDQISQAINDKDPQKHRWAFYLFYWKFVPALCKRFKVAICCEKKEGADTAPTEPYAPSGQVGRPPASIDRLRGTTRRLVSRRGTSSQTSLPQAHRCTSAARRATGIPPGSERTPSGC